MKHAEYRDIVEECKEFGWLDAAQSEAFDRIEKEWLLGALDELDGGQQVLASLFLQHEFLEQGVALAPLADSLPGLEPGGSLPDAFAAPFEAASASRGSLLLALSPSAGTRRQAAGAALAEAQRRGFAVLRASGRTHADGRRDPVYAGLVTELLELLDERQRMEFCVHRGQYLQLLAPLHYFPVRPGGVYNTDPGLNRTKLNKAFLELLLEALRRQPLLLLVEETQLLPRLMLEAIAYLAWIARNGTMGLTGLDAEDRMLDERAFLLLMTGSAAPEQAAWTELLRKRGTALVRLD